MSPASDSRKVCGEPGSGTALSGLPRPCDVPHGYRNTCTPYRPRPRGAGDIHAFVEARMFDRRTHACACSKVNDSLWTRPCHYFAQLFLIVGVLKETEA